MTPRCGAPRKTEYKGTCNHRVSTPYCPEHMEHYDDEDLFKIVLEDGRAFVVRYHRLGDVRDFIDSDVEIKSVW